MNLNYSSLNQGSIPAILNTDTNQNIIILEVFLKKHHPKSPVLI